MADKVEKKRTASTDVSGHSVSLSVADIKELFGLMKANDIAELNLEQKGTKIRIVSTQAQVAQQPTMPPIMMHGMAPMGMMNMAAPQSAVPAQPQEASGTYIHGAPAPAGAAQPAASAAPTEEAAPSNLKTIPSPMVGTFYRSPAPEAPAFVQVGDRVSEETTLCIIEAMKLMNELKAEMKGRVHKILVENGMPVEYNQPLFLIEPA